MTNSKKSNNKLLIALNIFIVPISFMISGLFMIFSFDSRPSIVMWSPMLIPIISSIYNIKKGVQAKRSGTRGGNSMITIAVLIMMGIIVFLVNQAIVMN